MTYLSLKRSLLNNYSEACQKEFILANRSGTYSSSSVIYCNTRKYHGLLVAPQPQLGRDNHVLLSSLDEWLLKDGREYALASHQYPGTIYPQGYRHLRSFRYNKAPEWVYEAENIRIRKTLLLSEESPQLLIRYEVLNARGSFTFRLLPFLAYRNAHDLRQADNSVNRKYETVSQGVRLHPSEPYAPLYLQYSKKPLFVPVPDWHYRTEYLNEQARGYDFREDLYVPGYFEFKLKKGDELIVSAGLEAESPRGLQKNFMQLLEARPSLRSFEDCLGLAARQHIITQNHDTRIIAGWHWFGAWGRDTFISLPGLTLARGDHEQAEAILDSAVRSLKDGLFPNSGSGSADDFNSVDAPLWFFQAVQQYASYTGKTETIWQRYGEALQNILDHYRSGTHYRIKLQENGLLSAGEPGVALSWMDAVTNGRPVTPRTGMPVEVNALWYNAICFALEVAGLAGDTSFTQNWQHLPPLIQKSFLAAFWDGKKGYLADCVDHNGQDWSLRPNQVIALSLPYSIPGKSIATCVLETVEKELLTPRGLRTLAPHDPRYRGRYTGDQASRDQAYHQGTVWPWLLIPFTEAYLKLYGRKGIDRVRAIYHGFEETLFEHGIGTVSEIYDGDEPHAPCGTISQAWSIAALWQMNWFIEQYKKEVSLEFKREMAS